MSDPRTQRDIARGLEQTQVAERPWKNYGTAIPTGYPNNVPYFRTDLGFWIYSDGTRQLTADFWEVHFPLLTVSATGDDVTTLQSMPSDYAPWIIAWTSRVNTGVTNTGAAFWTLRLRYSFTTTISSVDTSALPAATNDQTLGGGSFIEPAAAVLYLNVRAEKTGAPSNLTFHHYARYRYVIP